MRIAIVQNTLSVYNVPLFELIARAGHEVTLFTVYTEMDKWAESKIGGDASVLFLQQSFEEGRNRFAERVRPVTRLVKAVSDYSPDVIFIDGLTSLPTSIYLLARSSSLPPVVWWSLGRIPGREENIRAKLSNAVQSWCLRRCAAVISYGSYAADFFVTLGVARSRIVVGCNTIDEMAVARDMLVQAENSRRLRAELGGEAVRFIVFCGTIRENKGVDVLLRAFASIAPEYSDVRLLIIGGGKDYGVMRGLSESMGLSKSVRFVGEQRKLLSAYMMLGEFVVLPGLGGLAINHAFAHGLPVICGPADGMERDLVRTGKTGILLEIPSEENIATAMRELLSSPLKAKAMGAAASKFIYNEFTLAEYSRRVITAANLARKLGVPVKRNDAAV